MQCPFNKAGLSGLASCTSPSAKLGSTQVVGDEFHYVLDCIHFRAIKAAFKFHFQDAEGSVQLFMGHKDQKAASNCLAAILRLAQRGTQIRPYKP